MQLGNLLEQVLAPDQYGQNVSPNPESSERVEFAIKLPGKDDQDGSVWLPIDAKFPREDYERLVDAAERGDAEAVKLLAAALETTVLSEARKIRTKYVCPPHTTDFAILFLPTEGLYAEVLRKPGICDKMLAEKVVLAGPTTLAALLNSLQMGFRTLAIQKRSAEVWSVLGAVKTEFSKFSITIKQVEKKLQEASNKIGEVHTRSNVLNRKLRLVDAQSEGDSATILHLEPIVIAAQSDENEHEDEQVVETPAPSD